MSPTVCSRKSLVVQQMKCFQIAGTERLPGSKEVEVSGLYLRPN